MNSRDVPNAIVLHTNVPVIATGRKRKGLLHKVQVSFFAWVSMQI